MRSEEAAGHLAAIEALGQPNPEHERADALHQQVSRLDPGLVHGKELERVRQERETTYSLTVRRYSREGGSWVARSQMELRPGAV